jgi:hypothetical protein
MDNPADLILRGVRELKLNLQLWWQGPQWLQRSATSWLSLREVEMTKDFSEQRRKKSLVATMCIHNRVWQRFSSPATLIRVTAYVQHLNYNSQ